MANLTIMSLGLSTNSHPIAYIDQYSYIPGELIYASGIAYNSSIKTIKRLANNDGQTESGGVYFFRPDERSTRNSQ